MLKSLGIKESLLIGRYWRLQRSHMGDWGLNHVSLEGLWFELCTTSTGSLTAKTELLLKNLGDFADNRPEGCRIATAPIFRFISTGDDYAAAARFATRSAAS